jgi:hypothetical protein
LRFSTEEHYNKNSLSSFTKEREMFYKKTGSAIKIFIRTCLTLVFLAITINPCFSSSNPDKNKLYSRPELQQLSFLDESITQEEFQNTLCELRKVYGDEFYNDITKILNYPDISNQQHKILFLQLESWKCFTGSSMKLEEIDKILTEYFNLYPPTWTLKIKSVIFEIYDQKPPCIKNPDSHQWVLGSAEFDSNDNLWKIHINPMALRLSIFYNPSELCETFSHELAHTNDWKSVNMAPEQKLRFFQKVAERLNAQDHYADMDDYLNKIDLDTPEKTAYRKVVEYWAIISNAYFEKKRGLSQKDSELVESVIKYTDPAFIDVSGKAKERRRLIDKIVYN